MKDQQKKLDNRDMFGTPKNRSKTWDIKKSRDPKQDRRKSKKDLDDETVIENDVILEEDDDNDDDDKLNLGIYDDDEGE
tara:strand:- start:596 stop:832 length:237 start_codon:yes stop_codon:yes gene_type:complete